MPSLTHSKSTSCPYGMSETRMEKPVCACYAQPDEGDLEGSLGVQPRCSSHPSRCEYLAVALAVGVPEVPERRRAPFQPTA